MSVDARDRLVDFALERLHAPREEVDLAAQILDAWERGERGSDVSELIEPAEHAPVRRAPLVEPRPVAPRRTLVRASLAAVVLVAITAVLALFWTRDGGPSSAPGRPPGPPPVPIARAAAPVRVLRGAPPEDVTTSDILARDLVVIAHGASAEIVLASGGRFTARDGAVLALALTPSASTESTRDARASVALALYRGALDVACGPEALAIDTVLSTLSVAPPCAVFQAEVVWEPSSNAARTALASELVALTTDDESGPSKLRTKVESGALWITRATGRERLVAGTARDLVAPARAGEVTSTGRESLTKRLDAVLRGYAEPDSWQPFGPVRTPFERDVAKDLLALLAKEPQYWSVLEEDLAARIARFELASEPFRRVVDMLLADASGHGFDLGRKLWLLHPAGFRDVHIALFAERGAFEFEREAHARVALAEPMDGVLPVACAAWVAREGDRAGNELLWKFLDEPPATPTLDDIDRGLLAAFVLDSLERGDAWSRGVAFAADASEGALGIGRPGVAAMAALTIQYFDEARAAKRPVPIEALTNDLLDFIATRMPALAGAAEVRALLVRLRR
ncbi:MAG: hypothetical protein ACKVWV_10825 [Planctomycetota bacterium]